MITKALMYRMIPYMLISALLFLLPACSADNNENVKAANINEHRTKINTITVDHAMGSTPVPKQAERVVILTNEGTEALLALGVTPVGAVRSWTGDPWYNHLSQPMEEVEVVGTETDINLEAIAALQPDLIIGNKMRQEEVYERLNSIAPTVFAESLRGNWKDNFKLYAKALNLEEKGEKVLQEYDEQIESIRENWKKDLNLKISVVRFLDGEVRIYQKDSFSGVILDEIGFSRPKSQDVDDFAIMGVTKEIIPKMDGDLLLYFTYETGNGAASLVEEEWLKDPLFKRLPVVSRGDIYKVNDDVWNTAGGVLAAKLLIEDLEKILSARHSLAN